jgi:hypothetical protein
MAPDLGGRDLQNMAVVVAAGAASLALVTTGGPLMTGTARWWRLLVIGATATALVVLAVIVVLGTSLSGLVSGVLIQPTRQRDVFQIGPGIADAALIWALLAVGAAAAVRTGILRTAGPVGGLARLIAGLGMWWACTRTAPFTIGPGTSPLGVVPLLAWVAALAPSGSSETAAWRWARVALPAIAVLQTLHAYPVAGNQSGFALTLAPLLGAICIADGLRELEPWVRARAVPGLGPWGARWQGIATGLIAAWALLVFVGREIAPARAQYDAGVAMPYAGATRLHLPREDIARFRGIVDALRAARCSMLVSLPGQGSITIWSGLDAPIGLEPDSWSRQLSSSRQQEILDDVRRSPAPCALRNLEIEEFWQQSRGTPDRPLVRYINKEFRPAGTVGRYEILVPNR